MIKHYKHRGFVLVTSLLTTSILLIITIPYVARVVSEHKLMAKIYNATAALDLAEAGVERALWEISYNSSTFSGWTTTVDGTGVQTSTISVNAFKTADNQTIGDYDSTIVIAADGMSAIVTGKGYVPSRTSPDETRVVKVTYSRHNFGKAVVGLNGVSMSGQATTDSYDSTLGSYASQPHTQQGDIASNGAISLSGQAYVNGDANPGPSYPFSGQPNVSGSYGTLQAPLTVDPIPPSTITAAQTSNDNGNLTITHDGVTTSYTGGAAIALSGSDTLTIPGGTYYFTSISTTGTATINVTGPSTIYVDGGSVNISGQGIVNASQPKDLLLYSTGSSISLSGQAAFTGAIYAPSATVTLTGQENLYGSIICGSNIDSGQAAIHFDLDLMNVTPVFASNRVTSWRDSKQ